MARRRYLTFDARSTQIKAMLGTRVFVTVHIVALRLGLCENRAYFLLRRMCEAKLLERRRKGLAFRYFLASEPSAPSSLACVAASQDSTRALLPRL